jgi:maltodextrin utilization protein YvdJ
MRRGFFTGGLPIFTFALLIFIPTVYIWLTKRSSTFPFFSFPLLSRS